ncbi:LacI family transcriptional regulator [Kordiimonas sediminis]|uniref:LacI family transcriptional regulator n=1 Tax=Kordiimonas sediminis TaxID=1735581 RepID=A0A919E528_9PROT|nr:LacI family DNA-binding transcriptional regulator [Kordiimonas sediminis]GHF13816.1 LacI family transcriptional regulator [Kordiimonas sediminis]
MVKSTIKDVAQLAGVSLKTVSRVINKEPFVRQATIEKVSKAIEELGYQPNLAARNLRSGKSYALGLVYDNPNPYYIIDMQQGALNVCRDMGYGLQIHPCDAAQDNIAEELVDLYRDADLSGLILAPPMSERADIIKVLRRNDIQYVGIVSGTAEDPALTPCVHVDDRKAAYNITKHLLSLGHTHIAFFWGEEIHKSSPERFHGYEDALREEGITLDPSLIFDGAYSFESGIENAQKLLQLPDTPTALFCSNDEIAAGALTVFTERGLQVPHDIALAGFENSPFSRHSSPPLTTAEQSTIEIAAAATRLLIAGMRPHTIESENELVTEFSPTLIIRQSTCPVDGR